MTATPAAPPPARRPADGRPFTPTENHKAAPAPSGAPAAGPSRRCSPRMEADHNRDHFERKAPLDPFVRPARGEAGLRIATWCAPVFRSSPVSAVQGALTAPCSWPIASELGPRCFQLNGSRDEAAMPVSLNRALVAEALRIDPTKTSTKRPIHLVPTQLGCFTRLPVRKRSGYWR